uniref:Uncharacterized protein n=1 Tax=Aegilops tauschii subsp. strangulata TaxID=200361 RepID=A0A452YKL6_AEGTS
RGDSCVVGEAAIGCRAHGTHRLWSRDAREDLVRAICRTGDGRPRDACGGRIGDELEDLLGFAGGRGGGEDAGDDRGNKGIVDEAAIGGHDRGARRLRGRSSRDELGEQRVEQPGTGVVARLGLRLKLVKVSFQLRMHGGGKKWAEIGRTREDLWQVGRVEGGSDAAMLGSTHRLLHYRGIKV